MKRIVTLLSALLFLSACDAVSPDAGIQQGTNPDPSAPIALDAPAVASFATGERDVFNIAGEPELSHYYSIISGSYETPDTGYVECPESIEHSMKFAVVQDGRRFSFSVAGESLADVQEGEYQVGSRSSSRITAELPDGPSSGECVRNDDVFSAGFREEEVFNTAYLTPISSRPDSTQGVLMIERDEDGTLIATVQATLAFKRYFGEDRPSDASEPPFSVNATFRVAPETPVEEIPGPPLDARQASPATRVAAL